jgi:hypothetical protein
MSITDLKAEGPSEEYIAEAHKQAGAKFLMPTADDKWFLYEQGKPAREISPEELAEILGRAEVEPVHAPVPDAAPNGVSAAPES